MNEFILFMYGKIISQIKDGSLFSNTLSWLKQRLSERTTLDGTVLIAVSLAFILLNPIIEIVAYVAIAYGAWTMWKKG